MVDKVKTVAYYMSVICTVPIHIKSDSCQSEIKSLQSYLHLLQLLNSTIKKNFWVYFEASLSNVAQIKYVYILMALSIVFCFWITFLPSLISCLLTPQTMTVGPIYNPDMLCEHNEL